MCRLLLLLPLSLLLAQAPPGWKEFTIGPATRNASRFNPREGLRAEGIPLRRAIARAWGIPEYLIVGPEWIANQRYAITALISGEPQSFEPLFQAELGKRLHLEAHREKRPSPVYVLQRIDDVPHRLHETMGGESRSEFTRGSVTITGGTLDGLVQQLSLMLNRPVLDETGIPARKFDINLKWDAADPASLVAAAKEQLGLQLVEVKREVNFLVVDRVEQLIL